MRGRVATCAVGPPASRSLPQQLREGKFESLTTTRQAPGRTTREEMVAPRVHLSTTPATRRSGGKFKGQPAAKRQQEEHRRQSERLIDREDVEPHACAGPALRPEPSLHRRREERVQPVDCLSFHSRRSEVLLPAGPTRGDARRLFGGKGLGSCEARGKR